MSKISVIIPNYNCSQWLPKVIESCLMQKYLHEIIVVDDQSTDNSWEVLQELKKQNPETVKIFKNSKKGGNNARNFGFLKYAEKIGTKSVISDKIIKFRE